MLRREEREIGRRALYFPQVLRDARRIGEYDPGLSPSSAECMDKLGVALAHCESKCTNFTTRTRSNGGSIRRWRSCCSSLLPGRNRRAQYNHDVFDKDYSGSKKPGEQSRREAPTMRTSYTTSERQQRPRTLPRTAHEEPAQLRSRAALHGRRGRRDVATLPVDQPRETMETVRQNPSACAWPSLPISRTSPTTASMTTASVRPRGSLSSELRVVLGPAPDAQRVSM